MTVPAASAWRGDPIYLEPIRRPDAKGASRFGYSWHCPDCPFSLSISSNDFDAYYTDTVTCRNCGTQFDLLNALLKTPRGMWTGPVGLAGAQCTIIRVPLSGA